MVETITRRERTDPPYDAYAAIMATFVGGIAVTVAVATELRRRPPSRGALDLALLGLTAFKAARALAKAEVSFMEGAVRRRPGQRGSRMLTWSLASGGATDWLQAWFATLTGAANRGPS